MQSVHQPWQCKPDCQACKWISIFPNYVCMNKIEEINNLRFSIYYEGKGKEWAKCQVPARCRFSVNWLKALNAALKEQKSLTCKCATLLHF